MSRPAGCPFEAWQLLPLVGRDIPPLRTAEEVVFAQFIPGYQPLPAAPVAPAALVQLRLSLSPAP